MADKLSTNLSPYVAGSTAINALAGLALAVPMTGNAATTKGYQPVPKNPAGGLSASNPPALLFQYEAENTATFESDITDHYVENNTVIVDQIGLRPEQVTVSGFIGEVSNVLPPIFDFAQTIATALLTVQAYVPKVGATALIQINKAALLYQGATSIAQNAISAVSSLTGTGNNNTAVGALGGVTTVGTGIQNKQQDMFQQFYGYWSSRTLFNVQTPWAIFTNMAIKTLNVVQDADTRMVTNFTVTFKRIRTASTKILNVEPLSVGRALTQGASLTDNGTTAGSASKSLGTALGGV